MTEFRLVEAPPSVWRVQRRGWFFWRSVGFSYNPVCWFIPSVTGLNPVPAYYAFTSREDAERTLADAISNTAYRRVVELEARK